MELVLYQRPTCPYCIKVMRYLQQQSISVASKDVSAPGVHDELISIGGKRQVPCLVINGNALYESDDIIDWFAKNPQ